MIRRERYHVAVVHSPRGVRMVSVAESRAARDRDVAEYVRRHAPHQLAPRTCDRVLALLDWGAVPAAIDAYFDAVGREWDEEWLFFDDVPLSTHSRDEGPRSPGRARSSASAPSPTTSGVEACGVDRRRGPSLTLRAPADGVG